MRWSVVLSLAVVSYAVASVPEDTARLAARLKTLRGKLWLSTHQYTSLQAEYLAWIDSRVKAGGTSDGMNRELRAAGLLPQWGNDDDEMYKAHAGYLEAIATKAGRVTDGVFVLAAGIYMGAGCSLDVTALLYQRTPLTLLGQINADPGASEYAFYLSDLALGEKDADGARLVASGWTISNCTSNWNGKRVRIDRIREQSAENVLARDLNARDREGENVSAWVQRDVVTFWYDGGLDDSELMHGPAVATYRVVGDRAVRDAPVALTRAGFIHEWLGMDDAEAAQWGNAEAVAMRKRVASVVKKHGFEFERIARCDGSDPIWEVAVHVEDIDRSYVFRIGGSRATELRMLGIAGRLTPSCVAEDSGKTLASVGTELPW